MRGILAYTKSPAFGTGFSKKHSFPDLRKRLINRIYRIHLREKRNPFTILLIL